MTYPRSHLVDPSGGYYHVCSRCVRRAFLCGTDFYTERNFDHRREWVEDRIIFLSAIFAVDVIGYAVMSNHYHIVLNVRSSESLAWAEDDLVEKWLTLNPRKNETKESRDARKSFLLSTPSEVARLRERLGSLSWFMKYINEPIARMANQEDGCKGRFWEGRFKSQGLLDEAAILAAMVYVDLNPLRGGMVDEVLATEHTSLAYRVKNSPSDSPKLSVINKPDRFLPVSFTLAEYIELVRWTVTAQQSKRPTNMRGIPPGDLWIHHYLPKPDHWQRVLGSVNAIRDYAKEVGQCWIRTRSGQFFI